MMNKKCERTRKALPDFLRGHVFWTTRVRIERHLEQCLICRSEFDALRRVEETRRLLNEIDPPGGVGHRVKEGFVAFARLKKMLYRPLWLAATIVAVAGIYNYAMLPRQLDIEIDSIVRTAPSDTPRVSTTTALETVSQTATMPMADAGKTVPQPVSISDREPLVVSITPSDETSAIQRINEVMGEHGQLRKLKFSNTERELSGKLTAPELLTLFDRIREVSKVRYDRKRFESFSVAQQVPFVLMLKAAPKTVEKPLPARDTLQSARSHTLSATDAPAPPVTSPPPAH